jgi:hypothetical protein
MLEILMVLSLRSLEKIRRTLLLAAIVALVASMVAPGSSWAEEQRPLTERELFRQGVAAAEAGDLERALEHFEGAYARRPNQTVLYNIAQTYSALGRSVEAIRSLRAYLSAGNTRGDAARRREVEDLLRFNERRVGRIALEVDPGDALVEIDGSPVVMDKSGSVVVTVGRHVVMASHDEFEPETRRLDVAAGDVAALRLKLLRKAAQVPVPIAAPPPPPALGLLEVTCNVPEVTLTLRGVAPVRVEDSRLVSLPVGQYEIGFTRAGYQGTAIRANVTARDTARVNCRLEPDPNLLPQEGAELRVIPSEPDASVLVDGRPHFGRRLPAGAHVVTVSKSGFESWKRSVVLHAGRPHVVMPSLQPTAAVSDRRRLERRRTWALASGGSGVLLAGLAAALLVTNQRHYEDWQRDQRALSSELASGRASADHSRRSAELNDRAARIQRADDLALASGVVGGLLLITSASLYWFDGEL